MKKFLTRFILVSVIAFTAGCGLAGTGDVQQTPSVSQQLGNDTVEITLYFDYDEAMYLKPEKRTVKKAGKPMAKLLVQELISGPQTKGLSKTIPEVTRLISLEVADGVAVANFSREIKTRHPGGTAGERMTVQSIVHTLVQLPEIDKVQFLIEGEKEEAIWGHIYTAEPIVPDERVLAR
ncbi:MAG: GerMN domain-containing protein [Dethiobacter sp.]|nr:GerMN domain-containing protein [Dethiobacter sp.]